MQVKKKPSRKPAPSPKSSPRSIKLTGVIKNPKFIPTRSGTPMMTFELEGKSFKTWNGKVNAVAQYYNGRVPVEVTGELSDHINPKGGPVEYELRDLKPYFNTRAISAAA